MNNKMGESYFKLKWNVQGIFDNFSSIEKELEHQIDLLPENNLNDRKKLTNWINQLKEIDVKLQNFKTSKLIELEKHVNYHFAEPDLVVLTLIQPSIKNLFSELYSYYSKAGLEYNFEPYLNLDEAAKVLALIGDAVIDLALVQILWQPNISNVGGLSEKRADLASNKNLARICDKWDLFDFRIPSNPNQQEAKAEKVNHVKGTIVEALFGVMYVESGLDQIISSTVLLK
ncbi:hypothetical protein FTO70_10340 [Methanosarcina sp. KYL-1]|uniref:ribonuclease III domain-containing protein n=1 Tax=Methanosarcina sp. KYL-1 TaxID=2602068 RepID=UPI00210074BF|nr:ribonuclease III domain-containing protein [Methanosarcina sp. KYL-1]MCQ1536070.1 hypothetical protein [Methanosarcina sp. KYL-1]